MIYPSRAPCFPPLSTVEVEESGVKREREGGEGKKKKEKRLNVIDKEQAGVWMPSVGISGWRRRMQVLM